MLHNDLMMNKVEERESIVLTNKGQKIFAILHRPLSDSKYPAILMCHGLGGHKTGKYRLYVNLAERLAKASIATLRIDFRGSGDSEGEFAEMTLEEEVSDALKALEFLSQDPHVDPDRIGICGRSFGGAVAVVTARRFESIKSIALWAPVFNAEQWQERWKMVQSQSVSQETKEELIRINGMVPGIEFFKQLFKMRIDHELADLSHIPLLHIQGEKDYIVYLEHAEHYQRCRLAAQAESRFLRLPMSDHDFSYAKEQNIALEETWQWFEKTL